MFQILRAVALQKIFSLIKKCTLKTSTLPSAMKQARTALHAWLLFLLSELFTAEEKSEMSQHGLWLNCISYTTEPPAWLFFPP